MTLAEWLADQMMERHLSQGELASKVGVSKQAISLWLAGERSPGARSIHRLAGLFDVSADEILDRLDEFELLQVPS